MIHGEFAEGDVATARWNYEQARGKARPRGEVTGELVVRVLKDGEELGDR